MKNQNNNYIMIDYSIELDKSKLPKLIQNTITDLEKYAKDGEWIMYDNLAGGLEGVSKSLLLANKITDSQFEQIMKKYRGGIWL